MKSTRLLILTGFLCSIPAFAVPVRLAEVPVPVRKTIDVQKRESQVTAIDRRTSGTENTYDVEFVSTTHVTHLVIGSDGTVLQDSRKPNSYKPVVTTEGGFNGIRRIKGDAINWEQIPKPVVATIRSQKGQAKVDSFSQQMVNGHTIYTFAYMKNGQENYVNIAEDGTFVGNSAMTASAVSAIPAAPPNGSGLLFKDLPWTVQKPMLDQTGYANMTDVQKVVENGSTVYVGTYMKDGQVRKISVNDQGSVVNGGKVITEAAGAASTMMFKDLPWTVQKPMLDSTGSAKIESVNKVVANGTTIYVGNYMQNGQNKQIQVNDQGVVLSK